MGLSTDSSLWFNMAGIVAAYQPVAAPGPLQARYNMARGGTNAYQATGTPPTWAAPTGWTFDGSTHYLDTGLVPVRAAWSIIARYSGTTTASPERCVLGAQQSSSCTIAVGGYWYGDQCYCGNGTEAIAAPQLLSGTLAMAGPLFYRDGVFDSSQNSGADTNTRSLYIGALNIGSVSSRHQGNIQAIAIYARALSAAEVWSVTRQMQYCEKNPDWSVWSTPRLMPMRYAVPATPANHRNRPLTGVG